MDESVTFSGFENVKAIKQGDEKKKLISLT